MVAFILQLLSENVRLPLSLITDIELYTTSSCLVALLFSHYAAKVPDENPTGKQILTKRYAVISNSIAITINLLVLLIFFVFIPITLLSDDKMSWEYFWTSKTFAFILSTIAIVGHFLFVKFPMIEDDTPRIVIILCIWAAFNLFFEESKGVLFRELKGSKNIIKMSLSIFVIISTVCFYQILSALSLKIKKIDINKARK